MEIDKITEETVGSVYLIYGNNNTNDSTPSQSSPPPLPLPQMTNQQYLQSALVIFVLPSLANSQRDIDIFVGWNWTRTRNLCNNEDKE